MLKPIIGGYSMPQISWRKLSRVALNPQNLWMFSPLKISAIQYIAVLITLHTRKQSKHIWSFVAGHDEVVAGSCTCPCNAGHSLEGIMIDAAIGQDYFCDTGSETGTLHHRFYHNDPLWDGAGCGACYSFNSPPWFCHKRPLMILSYRYWCVAMIQSTMRTHPLKLWKFMYNNKIELIIVVWMSSISKTCKYMYTVVCYCMNV